MSGYNFEVVGEIKKDVIVIVVGKVLLINGDVEEKEK